MQNPVQHPFWISRTSKDDSVLLQRQVHALVVAGTTNRIDNNSSKESHRYILQAPWKLANSRSIGSFWCFRLLSVSPSLPSTEKGAISSSIVKTVDYMFQTKRSRREEGAISKFNGGCRTFDVFVDRLSSSALRYRTNAKFQQHHGTSYLPIAPEREQNKLSL